MPDNEPKKFRHYYGSIVRELLLFASIIMLVELPAMRGYVGIPAGIYVLGILALDFSAGLINPLQKWTEVINVIVSVVAFAVYENDALRLYSMFGASNIFFITDLILAFLFLLAIYFSVKTLRGAILKDKTQNP